LDVRPEGRTKLKQAIELQIMGRWAMKGWAIIATGLRIGLAGQLLLDDD